MGVQAMQVARGGEKSAQMSAQQAAEERARVFLSLVGADLAAAYCPRRVLGAFDHLAERAAQRFGLDEMQARIVFRAAVAWFREGRFDVLRPGPRLNAEGQKLFACALWDGRAAFFVFHCGAGIPLTVMCEGMTVQPHGARRKIELRGADYGL